MHHVGSFPVLEDQVTAFMTDFSRRQAGYSPPRVDALVWALTDLLIEPVRSERIYELYRRDELALAAHAAA